MKFPFNQPDKTNDCGYRCMYYVINPKVSYEEWLDNFRFFMPKKKGINFNDICTVLDHYKIESKFTELSENGLYIIYSGIWLRPNKSHGHYFVYHNGLVYCSLQEGPYQMKLANVIVKLEGKTVEEAYRCLKVEI